MDAPQGMEAGEVSLAQVINLARVAGRLATEARPLKDADLTRPDSSTAPTADVDELRRRGTRAADDLRRLEERLSGALAANAAAPALADLLAALALFGLREAIPMTAFAGASAADIVEQARGVERVLGVASPTSTLPPPDSIGSMRLPPTPSNTSLPAWPSSLAATFACCRKLRPADVDELAQSFGASVELPAATGLPRSA